jgi:hypothetical protein
MGQEDGHAERSNRSWLADALDPLENLRALADVQAFGRQAAEDLADRVLAWGEGGDGGALANGAASTPGTSSGVADVMERLRGDAVVAGEVSIRLVEHAMTLLGILLERLPAGASSASPAEALDLSVAGPGEAATAVFWVHNTSAAVVASVRPHCAPPRSHHGHELAADAVVFDPPSLDPLPARSTCGIEVSVRVPRGTPAGRYSSIVMASNVPDLYLPLHVTVRETEVQE